MGELRNEFSWSNSRARVFDECRRKYWFQYYGYWNGWSPTCDERTRAIYVLKKLRSRYTWVGELVHDSVGRALRMIRSGQTPNPAELGEGLIQRMRTEFKLSRDRRYWENPKEYPGLLEHEYGAAIPDEGWQTLAEHARRCLDNFFASPYYAEMSRLPADHWLTIEDKQDSYFFCEGVKVWAIPDCAYRRGRGAVIIDWKTGKADGEADPIQLPLYAMYAARKWKFQPQEIITVEYNLGAATERVCVPTEEHFIAVRARIAESVRAMQELLVSGLQDNIARQEHAFSVTGDLSACKRCPFLKVCPDSPLNNL